MPASYGGSRGCRLAGGTQQKGCHTGGFGCQLQTPGRRRSDRFDLAEDRGQAAAAQPFLHRPQDIDIPAPPDQDQARRLDPEKGESRPVDLVAPPTPQDALSPAGPPCQKAGAEPRGRAEGTENLMQGGARQSSPRQRVVDLGRPQGPDAGRLAVFRNLPFEPADARPQCLQKGRVGPSRER